MSDNEAPDLRPNVWDLIRDDPELKRARQRLSLHEIRRIIQHAHNSPRDDRTPEERLASLHAKMDELSKNPGNLNASRERVKP